MAFFPVAQVPFPSCQTHAVWKASLCSVRSRNGLDGPRLKRSPSFFEPRWLATAIAPTWDGEQTARLDAVVVDGKTYQVASWKRKGMVTGLVAEISREDMKALSGATKYDAEGQAFIPGALLVAFVSSP